MAPRQAGAALWRSSVVQRVGPRGHAALVLVDHLAAAGAPPAAEPDADEADDHDVERASPPGATAAARSKQPPAPVASTSRCQRAQPPASVDRLDADAGMGKMKNRVGEDKERESRQAAWPSPARRHTAVSETESGWKWNE